MTVLKLLTKIVVCIVVCIILHVVFVLFSRSISICIYAVCFPFVMENTPCAQKIFESQDAQGFKQGSQKKLPSL